MTRARPLRRRDGVHPYHDLGVAILATVLVVAVLVFAGARAFAAAPDHHDYEPPPTTAPVTEPPVTEPPVTSPPVTTVPRTTTVAPSTSVAVTEPPVPSTEPPFTIEPTVPVTTEPPAPEPPPTTDPCIPPGYTKWHFLPCTLEPTLPVTGNGHPLSDQLARASLVLAAGIACIAIARRRRREPVPARVDRDRGSVAIGVVQAIAAIVFVAVIAVLLYLGAWWIQRDSVDRTARINQDSYARQNALVEQILDDVREANDPSIPPAQRSALVDIICDSAGKLTGSVALPSYAARFVTEECPS